MKHPKQSKRAPVTHPSALAAPSYQRILVKHGLIEKTPPLPDVYKVFLKWALTQKYRNYVAR